MVKENCIQTSMKRNKDTRRQRKKYKKEEKQAKIERKKDARRK